MRITSHYHHKSIPQTLNAGSSFVLLKWLGEEMHSRPASALSQIRTHAVMHIGQASQSGVLQGEKAIRECSPPRAEPASCRGLPDFQFASTAPESARAKIPKPSTAQTKPCQKRLRCLRLNPIQRLCQFKFSISMIFIKVHLLGVTAGFPTS